MDTTKDPEQMEQIYKETLHTYKRELDNITARGTQMMSNMHNYENKIQAKRDESTRIFDEFLNQQKEVATGLIYAKTGRMITDRTVNQMTRRQV